jgi:hypothetical protein
MEAVCQYSSAVLKMMKTQSQDTSIEAEHVLIDLIRKASVAKRFQLVQSLTQGSFLANIQAQKNNLDGDERETLIHFASILYGTQLAQQLQTALMIDPSWHIQPVDLATLIFEVAQVLDELHAEWYLGGSLASSLHGMQQLAQDVDFIVYIDQQRLPSLLSLLKEQHLLHEDHCQGAVSQRSAFPFIHLASLMKVDIVLPRCETFDTAMKPLVAPLVLDEHYPAYPVASASEMILFKLSRYYRDAYSRKDGMRNDAEWNDILGMLKIQGMKLNFSLLERCSKALNIMDVWGAVLTDAGLKAA